MGNIHKLSAEIVRYIQSKKRGNLDLSCRGLSKDVCTKFGIKVSKSSINKILQREKLSSPVGRRSKRILSSDMTLEHGGFYVLIGIDYFLGLTRTASEVLCALIPGDWRAKKRDVECVIQALLIFKSIYDTTFDFPTLYSNDEIWVLVGRRPSKVVYTRIINFLESSQLFIVQLVAMLKDRLKPVSGFRFVLSDQSRFFVDSKRLVLSSLSNAKGEYCLTNYGADRYVSRFVDDKEVFTIFNSLGSSLVSEEVSNLVAGFSGEDSSKRLDSIELMDFRQNILDRRLIFGSLLRFFMLGFWPWQLYTMYDLESRPATEKLFCEETGKGYYYQVEELNISQLSGIQGVKLNVVLLKTSPLGAVEMGVLTNIPKIMIPNYLNYNNLYKWMRAQKDQMRLVKSDVTISSQKNFFTQLWGKIDFAEKEKLSIESIFEFLSQIAFLYFQYQILPEGLRSWSQLKIKDVFLRKKAKIEKRHSNIVCNSFISKELRTESLHGNACQKMNNLEVFDDQDRRLLFKFSVANNAT
ncbi:hypothetical protein ACFL96_17985 [Thermoproteota archaeon]